MYELLEWMTGDAPFTHQLPRFAEECKPWLLRWFPELGSVGTDDFLDKLDWWLDFSHDAETGIHHWLISIKGIFKEIKDEYDVPKIPMDDHTHKDPYDELVEMRGTDEGIIIV